MLTSPERPPSRWWLLLYPILRIRLWYFRRLVGEHGYPPPLDQDERSATADGVALIGSVDADRVGVNLDDLTALGRTAAAVRALRQRDITWLHGNRDILAVADAASLDIPGLADARAAVLILGFSDVLMMTTPQRWTAGLEQLIRTVRTVAEPSCGIVIVGLAPADEFRYTARLGRKRIR